MRNPEQTAGSMADKASVAYISYIDADGFPETRAMLAPGERNCIREFRLTTNTSSQKVKSFKSNRKPCLYFADRRFFRGVCLSGTVEVLETPEAKERIWRDGDEQHCGQGVTDPDCCVLKFTAKKGGAITAATGLKILRYNMEIPQNSLIFNSTIASFSLNIH